MNSNGYGRASKRLKRLRRKVTRSLRGGYWVTGAYRPVIALLALAMIVLSYNSRGITRTGGFLICGGLICIYLVLTYK